MESQLGVAGPSATTVPALRVHSVSKSFGDLAALNDVALEIVPGSIHGLVGSNGSGKSTIIKILAGIYPADSGLVSVYGSDEVSLTGLTPSKSRALGLRFVHQNIGVIDDMTVAENLAIASPYPTNVFGTIQWRDLEKRAQAVLEKYEINASPRQRLGDLGQALKMQLAIARCLEDHKVLSNDITLEPLSRQILFLDEPTASLPWREARGLADALRRHTALGTTFVFVSHRIDEILSLADNVTALRDGVVEGVLPASRLTRQSLVGLMHGKSDAELYPPTRVSRTLGPAVLQVKGLSSGPLSGVELTVNAGEIVGVGALLGSGRTRLLRSIFGAVPRTGEIIVGSKQLRSGDVRAAMDAGVALIPENRVDDGVFMDLDVADNISIAALRRYWTGVWLRFRRARRDGDSLLATYRIKAPDASTLLGSLSGGNQQKVVLARWLSRRPTLLLLDEPTQGVDVSARREIYELIRKTADDGGAVLVVSSDLEEIAGLCDRVLFLQHGQIGDQLKKPFSAHDIAHRIYEVSG